MPVQHTVDYSQSQSNTHIPITGSVTTLPVQQPIDQSHSHTHQSHSNTNVAVTGSVTELNTHSQTLEQTYDEQQFQYQQLYNQDIHSTVSQLPVESTVTNEQVMTGAVYPTEDVNTVAGSGSAYQLEHLQVNENPIVMQDNKSYEPTHGYQYPIEQVSTNVQATETQPVNQWPGYGTYIPDATNPSVTQDVSSYPVIQDVTSYPVTQDVPLYSQTNLNNDHHGLLNTQSYSSFGTETVVPSENPSSHSNVPLPPQPIESMWTSLNYSEEKKEEEEEKDQGTNKEESNDSKNGE